MTARWNANKPHRCPNCHNTAIGGERPSSWHVYTCCRCAARFTRWPWLARFLPDTGIRCGEHATVRDGILDDALHVIVDPDWRRGLGWENARNAVQHLKNGTHPSQFQEKP